MAGKEEGFTLIELLVVIVILGILLAIAVPSYMGFRDRALQRAAESNVRAAIPAAEAWYADHGDYSTLDVAGMKAIDRGISKKLTVPVHTASHYCLQDQQSATHTAHATGPGGTAASGTC
jgi:type IV pilus assembly protein PilA